jgi:uncharacterized protein involved in propanediol utilization
MRVRTRGQVIMKARDFAMTTAGVVALAASAAAGLMTWLLMSAPVTLAMTIEGTDAEPFVQVAARTRHEVLMHLVRYL